jgi:hypothetical protein
MRPKVRGGRAPQEVLDFLRAEETAPELNAFPQRMRPSQKELSHPPESSGMGEGRRNKSSTEGGYSTEWLGDALADGGGGEPGIAAKQLVPSIAVENHGYVRTRQA